MAGQRVLSYPFRFDMYNQRLATVNSDTDTHKAEQINTFLKTEKGERALFPDFVSFYKPNEIEILDIEINNASSFGEAQDIAVRFK